MTGPLRTRAPLVLAFAWLAAGVALLVAYYLGNEPLERVAARLYPLPLAALFLAALAGLGLPLARRLAPGPDAVLPLLASVPLGMGLTGVLTLLLGILGAFRAPIYAAWYVAGLVLLADHLRRRPRPPWPRLRPGGAELLAAGAIGLALVSSVPFVVAPVASTDSLQYHLLIPQIYLSSGHIHRIPLLIEASYPSLAEYNYLPLLLLADDTTCKVLHFGITMLVLLAVMALVRRIEPGAQGLLGAALFLCMPVTLVHMAWAWNDFTFTLMVLASLLFLLRYHSAPVAERRGRDLLAAGLLGGLASWTKYTFVLYLGAALIVLAAGERRWGWRRGHLPLFLAGFAAVVPLWAGQNWILSGNPVHPFLHGLFRSPYWTDTADRYLHEALRRYEVPHWSWKTWLTFPLHISLTPRILEAHTGILPLLLIPALFAASRTRGMTMLRTFLLGYLLVWLPIHTENRSLLSLFAVLFAVTSAVLERPGWPDPRLRRPLLVLVAAALASGFWMSQLLTGHLSSSLAWFFGLETREAYLARVAESHEAYADLNARAEVKGVLLVSLHGPYYLRKPYLFSSFADPPAVETILGEPRDAPAIHHKLRALGLTHIAINLPRYAQENRDGLYSWSPAVKLLFERFVREHCREVARFGTDVVLEIRDAAPGGGLD